MIGKKNEPHVAKVLEVDASLQGNLVFKEAVQLRINGSFEGNLETKGDLHIGANSAVKANIIGERITVAGRVTGDVTAFSEFKLAATGRLVGNITSPSLIIEKGGVFHGNSRMLSDDDRGMSSHKVFLNLDEVARYLSVETALISEWAANGKLPALRDGEGWRFEKQRVDEWIANGRIK